MLILRATLGRVKAKRGGNPVRTTVLTAAQATEPVEFRHSSRAGTQVNPLVSPAPPICRADRTRIMSRQALDCVPGNPAARARTPAVAPTQLGPGRVAAPSLVQRIHVLSARVISLKKEAATTHENQHGPIRPGPGTTNALKMSCLDWKVASAQWPRGHPEGRRDVERGHLSSAQPGLVPTPLQTVLGPPDHSRISSPNPARPAGSRQLWLLPMNAQNSARRRGFVLHSPADGTWRHSQAVRHGSAKP